jgi:hypothetical protein
MMTPTPRRGPALSAEPALLLPSFGCARRSSARIHLALGQLRTLKTGTIAGQDMAVVMIIIAATFRW